MPNFFYKDQVLHLESFALTSLVQEYGSPLYIYSEKTLLTNVQSFKRAFAQKDALICYAVKANSNLTLLKLFAEQGLGFDIVSQGELERVLVAGGDPSKVVFSGVAKSYPEIKRALEVGIHCFNVESISELKVINQVAQELGCLAPISIRVNPDVDAQSHPYISTGLTENKFGIDIKLAVDTYKLAAGLGNLKIVGLDCHIGSQILSTAPFLEAVDCLIELILELKANNIDLEHLDLGGGLGVNYTTETPPSIEDFIQQIYARLESNLFSKIGPLKIIVEPGRSLVANAGALVTKVEYIKENHAKNFAIVDAGMNDLLRPSLYQATMAIKEVQKNAISTKKVYDVVGPVCETGDFLGKDVTLSIVEGDLLVVLGAGAYGSSMSSNYNSRCKAAEVLVTGNKACLISKRQEYAELWQNELI